MTWLDKYNLSIKLASIYSYEYPKDIAHDAWIAYMKTTGNDLFAVEIDGYSYYLSTIIRRSFLRFLRKERLFDSKGERYIYFGNEELQSNLAAPDEAIFARDLYSILLKRIKDYSHKAHASPNQSRFEEIFHLKSEGYDQVSIAEKLEVNKSTVNHYTKKMSLVNPFNGNKLKITRTINKDTWDKKSDKEDYERDDYNEYFELWKHKESGQGILVRLNK